MELDGLKRRHETLTGEIASLRKRRSNIDAGQIRIRRMLAEALGIDEAAMPFAGELIQVLEEARAWEGAAERLLHNFGLSLLVPEYHYAAVADWVDRTHLKGRLVYYRVRTVRPPVAVNLRPDSLAGKLMIKPDSAFYGWLEHELAKRFDYACCETIEQFHRRGRP